MSKRLGTVVAVVAVMTSQVGCYTTKVVSQARPDGPAYTDRQWFTIGGLVPLSGPAGRECESLSTVESKLSGTDWLINAGLGIAGGIVGGLVCGGSSNDPYLNTLASASCAAGFSTLVPFLISSRTVEYTCAEGYGGDNRGSGRLDYMPPRQGYRVAPQQEGAPAEAPPAQTP
ncbi:hypothetical protein CYFUS_009839 [Cystobacter fuscus]|uniref:Uncharacterized protein n=1 Tax=Cystobacter fuscus TaxID=43 RepID=A0A250JLK8_9BACT|nr:hypothetical protein [Cystobacter fuscus]ATB44352.1 hypothetical protein CYFUS_009839 [Cystobacter fuscus]